MAGSLFMLNENDEDEELKCVACKHTRCRTVLYWMLCVITVGGLWLVCRWRGSVKARILLTRCPVASADTILVKDISGDCFLVPVVVEPVDNASLGDQEVPMYQNEETRIFNPKQNFLKYFEHHFIRYVWDPAESIYTRLRGLEAGVSCGTLRQNQQGLSAHEAKNRLQVHGENSIKVEVKSYGKLLFDEVLNPFYIFQVASVTLWSFDNYYYYASCIVFISIISLVVAVREVRKQSEALSDMVASHSQGTITVCRPPPLVSEAVSVQELVPGDVILIPREGLVMSCDAVLTAGNCIVNESMLTGESVPVTKTALAASDDDEEFSPTSHKRHTLFSGTHVIQTRFYGGASVTAVVVRTGFSTAKGELVRSILFPKQQMFKFYKDAMRFIGVLGCLALIGMAYSTTIYILHKESLSKIIVRALDIITIVVPPALPAAMTVGTVYAQSRLKKQHIFCISPPKINICGKLNLVCFDKTGTLTEDGLALWGVVPARERLYLPVVREPRSMARCPLITAMAACHSLTRIDGELTGDPLDLQMFESTGWHLEEPGTDTTKFDALVPTIVKPVTRQTYVEDSQEGSEVGIIRQFPFASALQRLTVLTRVLGADHMDLFCKGAPEKVASLCRQDTLPLDFSSVLHQYTMQGYRVIAVAWRPLDPKLSWHHAHKVSRDVLEKELEFLGLVVLQNGLKRETTPVIAQLRDAHIRTVMITGDNMHTAVSVARECGMVPAKDRVVIVNAHPPQGTSPARVEWDEADLGTEDDGASSSFASGAETALMYQGGRWQDQVRPQRCHLAVSGKSFGVLLQHFPRLLPKICVAGTVFARMSPDQKTQLVEQLQELGYYVGMCGDGANDCGALKAAHAGVSLSEAEASVASPFTSRQQNIRCVPTVIREGRAALVTSFGTFKYMALYSLIQCISVLILYTKYTNLSDFQFLYVDLFIVTLLAILMGRTAAYETLVKEKPSSNLMSVSNLVSLMLQVLLQAAFQGGAMFYLIWQPWYTPLPPSYQSEEKYWSYETTVVFGVSSFQYITTCVIFSTGPPFRRRLYTNVPFLLSILVLVGGNVWLALKVPKPIADFIVIKPLHDYVAQLVVLGLAAVNFFMSLLIELVVTEHKMVKRCLRRCWPKRYGAAANTKPHKRVARQLAASTSWPPVGEVTLPTDEEVAVHISRSPGLGVQNIGDEEDEDWEDEIDTADTNRLLA